MPKQLVLASTPLAEDALLPRHEKLEIPDRVAMMIRQEETDYQCIDYLVAFKEICRLATKPVDEDCRVKMCEWCYQVVDFCKFRRETVGIGMSYLDRYLCSKKGRRSLSDRKEYQLVAMTCLYIAIKIHEPLEMETSLLADLSRGCYTEMEFANMEQKILEALVWRVGGPTPLSFAQNLLLFLPDTIHSSVRGAIFDYARYQTELAIADHYFVKLRPSVVGMAAVLNAMEGINPALLPYRFQHKFVQTVMKYTTINVDEVEEVQVRLSKIMLALLSDEEKKKMEAAIDEDDSDEEYEGPRSRSRHSKSRSRSPFSSPEVGRRKVGRSPRTPSGHKKASPSSSSGRSKNRSVSPGVLQ
eukprot:scaffold11675_cov123-Cylindrotheca_fusiformis.AAC.2